MGGAARPANSTVLPAEQSAVLRDRLVKEIAGLESQDKSATRAREALSLKPPWTDEPRFHGAPRSPHRRMQLMAGVKERDVGPSSRMARRANCELIAGLRPSAQGSQVMGIGRLAAAPQARLLGHEPEVLLVPVAAWGAQREHALVDPGGLDADRRCGSRRGIRQQALRRVLQS